ncbi:MAG: DNA-methyltransferase [Phycisphaerales bacterium]
MKGVERPEADIYCRSCESMPELADGSVTLTFTSPPYWSLVDFATYARTGSRDAAWHNTYDGQYRTYGEYLAAMTRVFAEVYRVTKPGGFLALQVASMQRDGRCYPIGFDMVPRLVELGWEYREFILWNKTRDTSQRAGLAIQHPYPGYYYPSLIAEHLIIFRKPGPKLFKNVDPKMKERSRLPISPVFTRDVLKSVWHIPVVHPSTAKHPTVYPEELCQRVIALWSYPGDLVLDPFLGSGQTTKVARAMGRRSVGYDIEPEFVELAQSRLDEPLQLRRKQIIPRYDHVEDDEFLHVGLIREEPVPDNKERASTTRPDPAERDDRP